MFSFTVIETCLFDAGLLVLFVIVLFSLLLLIIGLLLFLLLCCVLWFSYVCWFELEFVVFYFASLFWGLLVGGALV